jgi:hypothetical protein
MADAIRHAERALDFQGATDFNDLIRLALPFRISAKLIEDLEFQLIFCREPPIDENLY